MLVDKLGLLAGQAVERVATGATWSEGPCWVPSAGAVRWSDIPNDRILQWVADTGELQVYQSGVEFTNGRTLGLSGEIVQCSHGNRRIEQDVNGQVSALVDRWEGRRLNSPNDVIVKSDGTIWFSDPAYGIFGGVEGHPGEMEYQDCWVFRFDPASGDIRPVVTDVRMPNGLAFSPDETLLYVSDTSVVMPDRTEHPDQGHWIRVYDVVDGILVKNGRHFVTVDEGVPDGFRVDAQGNVWTSSDVGVLIFNPTGEQVGFVPVPEKVGNLCFGGPDGRWLYVVATTSLYRIRTTVIDAAWHG